MPSRCSATQRELGAPYGEVGRRRTPLQSLIYLVSSSTLLQKFIPSALTLLLGSRFPCLIAPDQPRFLPRRKAPLRADANNRPDPAPVGCELTQHPLGLWGRLAFLRSGPLSNLRIGDLQGKATGNGASPSECQSRHDAREAPYFRRDVYGLELS